MASSKNTSPGGSNRLRSESALGLAGFIFYVRCAQKLPRFGRLVLRHLDQYTSGGHGVAIQAERGEFVRHHRVKIRRFEAGPHDVCVGWIERRVDGHQFHSSYQVADSAECCAGLSTDLRSAKMMT